MKKIIEIFIVFNMLIMSFFSITVYAGHTMVLYGYTINSSGSTYRIWDTPYDTYKIMDANTRLVTSDNTHVYRWNSGYVYNISK